MKTSVRTALAAATAVAGLAMATLAVQIVPWAPAAVASPCASGLLETAQGCCDPSQKFCCPPGAAYCTARAVNPGDPGDSPTPSKGSGSKSACVPPSGPGIPPGTDCRGCTWQQTTSIPAPGPDASNFQQMLQVWTQWHNSDPPGILDLLTCYPGGAQSLMFFYRDTPPPNAPDTVALGARAEALLPFPIINPHIGPDRAIADYPMAIVNLPIQLWLDPADFAPITATAADGLQTVTATADPTRVTWDMGNGRPDSVFTCPNAGTAWQNHTMPEGCVYTYRRSTANLPQLGPDPNDRPLTVTVKVDYTITWTCAGACDGARGGTFTYTNAAAMLLAVGEIQSVNY